VRVLNLASSSSSFSTSAAGKNVSKIQMTNSSNSDCRTLYPAISPNYNGTIQLDSVHTLYYEEYGTYTDNNENNKTALSLHGGPGAGCYPSHARFFDPDIYGRIILFDQRGCGKSKPSNQSEVGGDDSTLLTTQNNTLSHLVDDIETLRVTLGIKQWDVVLGGSWGSTLALAYAQKYPNHLASIVLRGVCLFRDEEIDWLFSNKNKNNAEGALATLNPTGWKIFEEFITKYYSKQNNITNDENNHEFECSSVHSSFEQRRHILHSYYDCLLGADPILRFMAAKAWFQWEMTAGSFHKQQQNTTQNQHLNNDNNLLEWIPSERIWTLTNSAENTTTAIEHSSNLLKRLRKWSMENVVHPQQEEQHDNNTTNWQFHRDEIIKPVEANLSKIYDSKDGTNLTEEQIEFATSFVPSQAMLTCFYSVNNQKMTSDNNFYLSSSMINKIKHIPCIAIQGGNDYICPPDTALDLHELWPDMKLRIPLKAGHSMYDPAITHELIKATDFLGKQKNTKKLVF